MQIYKAKIEEFLIVITAKYLNKFCVKLNLTILVPSSNELP